jgi:class 3 adenylate cyclase/pimeloyl-ACP methyl ester carboxylesterase
VRDVEAETRYAKADDGVHIAYQVIGEADLDLVVVPGFISHVEAQWEEPRLARFLRRLASFSRLIMFDKRGTGMSDRTDRLPDVDRRMLDIQAVMDAVGSREAALFAISEGGPMAILFAAAHPERTRALVLWGSYARISQAPDYEIGLPKEALRESAAHMEAAWGTGVALGAWAPSVAGDPAARTTFARFQRLAASPGAAVELLTSLADIDVRPALPLVHAPTLVLHRNGEQMVDVVQARYVAERIPGARLVEFDGTDHFWFTEDADAVVDEIEEFLTGSRLPREADRVLAAVLFTDIVDSTKRVAASGDRAWRSLLERHDELARQEVRRSGGRLIKRTGDGVLATFDGPARSVQCASAIVVGAGELGIEVRAGAHIGELEVRTDVDGEDDIAGIAVHLAQRICATARPQEVLVSRTIVDLVAGSGLEFESRGEAELKGIPGRWELLALSNRGPGIARDVRPGGGGAAESRCRGWRFLHVPDRQPRDEHRGRAADQHVFRGRRGRFGDLPCRKR